jgi:hypothetical protein
MFAVLHWVWFASARLVAPIVVPSGRDWRSTSPFLRVFRVVPAVVHGHAVRLGGLVLVDSVQVVRLVLGVFVLGRGFWLSHASSLLGADVTDAFVDPFFGLVFWLGFW